MTPDYEAVLTGLIATVKFGLWTLVCLLALGVVVAVGVGVAFFIHRAKEQSE